MDSAKTSSSRQGARRHDDPLPRGQLRLWLQVGGQRRPARPAPEATRPGVALHRDQPGRDARVPTLAGQGRQRAHARGQPRHERRRRSPGPARVRQPAQWHPARPTAHRQRPQGAVRRAHVVPGQRDGRALAARPSLCRRLREARRDDRSRHEGLRPRPRARPMWLLQLIDAHLRKLGAHGPVPRLRPGRLHLLPLLLREQGRPRQLPRLRRRHGHLHSHRRSDRG